MPPKYLYKYRRWDCEYHKRILTHNEIFFTSPKRFNDPFDCTIPIRFDLRTEEQELEALTRAIESENPDKSQSDSLQMAKDRLMERLMSGKKTHNEMLNRQQQLRDNMGIFTVSEKRDSILMWSHYSDHHNGFCVGFNREKLDSFFDSMYETNKTHVFPVEVCYLHDYPVLHPAKLADKEFFEKQFESKFADWSYEKEHRFIIDKGASQKLFLDDGIIAEVILGMRMSDVHKNEVIQVLRDRSTKVALYQAHRKETAFGLNFTTVDY